MVLADGRIFHVNVNCSELDRSRRFYVDCLGLTDGVRTAAENAQPGTAFGLDRARWDAWILLGPRAFEGSAIDLLEWQEPAPQGAPPARFETCGFQRLGVVVTDLDAAMKRVRELGGAVWSEPFTHAISGGGEIRLVMANDPDGTALELIEGDAPSVAFVAVACADLDASIEFYRALGFRDAARFHSTNEDGGHLRVHGPVAMEEVLLRAPTKSEMNIMLVGFSAPPPIRAEARPANSIGMWRTALLVTDLDAGYRELGRLGVTTISAPTAMAMGPGLPELRFLCFAGPDGEVLELIEQPVGKCDMTSAIRGQQAEEVEGRVEILREAATMVLYVSVVEIAEFAALPEGHFAHGRVTGPVSGQLLAILWGTAIGLAIAHWFAFGIAAPGFRGETPTGHDLRIGLAQFGGAMFVAAVSSLPVLFFSDARAQETVGDVPAIIIGVIGYFVARAAGKSRVPSAFYGLTALALGIVVALVKTALAAH